MNNTHLNAQNAARLALQDIGADHPDAADYDYASAQWIRSYIKDRDISALCEFVCEQPDGRILNMFAMLADALEHSNPDCVIWLGNYMAEIASDYIAVEVEKIAANMGETA